MGQPETLQSRVREQSNNTQQRGELAIWFMHIHCMRLLKLVAAVSRWKCIVWWSNASINESNNGCRWLGSVYERLSSRVVAGYMRVLVPCQRSLMKRRSVRYVYSSAPTGRPTGVPYYRRYTFGPVHPSASPLVASSSVVSLGARLLLMQLHATPSTRLRITSAPSTHKMDWPRVCCWPCLSAVSRLSTFN